MTVKELCKEYGLKFQTVYKKIKNHCNKELDGHITKVKGKSLELDEFAVNFDSLKADLSNRDNKITELTKQLETEQDTFRQTVTELESRVMELTEENKLLTEKYEAVPKIFRKNQ